MSNATNRVAVVQMASGDDLQANLTSAAGLLQRARTQGAKLAVLPENFAFMGRRDRDKCQLAEHFGTGPIQDFLAEQAVRQGLWLVAGTIPLRANDDYAATPEKVCAASLVFNSDGACVGRYDKIHLFDVQVPGKPDEQYRESAGLHAGEKVVVVNTPCGRLGLSVCYDLRFPELYRALVDRHAELLSVPAAFTEATGKVHWDMLLKARAVENQCFILAPNQGGEHPGGRRTYGHSQILDPWGECLARHDAGPGLAVADLDLQHLKDIRHRFPALKHRRPGLFNAS